MLEVSALAVGSNEYTLLCAFNSVLFLKQIAENAECNCRLGCLTRFGNNINAESASAADINQLLYCQGADIIARKLNFRHIVTDLLAHV